jgi:HD superfamily phosphohydrolase
MHDVGHLPLSHLFEMGFADYVFSKGVKVREGCEEWFGLEGFSMLHEACGAYVAKFILENSGLNGSVKDKVIELITTKDIERGDALFPVKKIIDSAVDADRIDSTARDGLQAGGEYGNYDIERLCSSFSIIKTDGGWDLGYSHKARNCLESLLFERYRTHTWIHFHHRVIAIKTAARLIIKRLLEKRDINKNMFELAEIWDRDDVWLWRTLRDFTPENGAEAAAKELLIYRNKERTSLLWKDWSVYDEKNNRLLETAGMRRGEIGAKLISDILLSRDYGKALEEEFSSNDNSFIPKLHVIEFKPTGKYPIYILRRDGTIIGDLHDKSRITGYLHNIWKDEPQYYIVIFGEKPKNFESDWISFTAEYLREKAS